MDKENSRPNFRRQFFAWLVHCYTASAAVLGLLALYQIAMHEFILSFWYMIFAVVVDATDGYFARKLSVKKYAPRIDGCTLDNIVDYLNYVMVPAFFLLIHPQMLSANMRLLVPSLIVMAAAYQFSQQDAKTSDNFFKGFPSYFNLLVFHLFMWRCSEITNAIVLVVCCCLVFVPIKYIYPSRLESFSKSAAVRYTFFAATVIYCISLLGLLLTYPNPHIAWSLYAIVYIGAYFSLSVVKSLEKKPRAL